MPHRPYPPPDGRWVMAQTWHDLLFLHWPVDEDLLRSHVPAGLEIERFDGRAWIGVIPFHMSGIRVRGLPAIPGLSAFPELNVRTYVRHGGRPGVWFFSLDAAHRIAVSVARRWFHLGYRLAEMSWSREGQGVVYTCRRLGDGSDSARWEGRYEPDGPVAQAAAGSFESFLVDRYCLYSADRHGRLYRGEIDHDAWPLQPARAEVDVDTMTGSLGIERADAPASALYVRSIDVRLWSIHRVS